MKLPHLLSTVCFIMTLVTGTFSTAEQVTIYWKNGNKKSSGDLINHKKEGPWKYFDESGRLYLDAHFKNGQLDGAYKCYYPNGNVESEELYVKGKLDGPVTNYCEGGTISGKGQYLNGKRSGCWTWYDDNGNVSGKEIHRDGRTFRIDYNNGVPGEEICEEDLNKSEERKSYYSTGKLREQGHVDLKGYKIGIWRSYYPNGVFSSETEYMGGASQHADTRSGLCTTYYIDGKIKSQSTYGRGQLKGIVREYYANGSLHTEGNYDSNVRNGFWNEYNESGRPLIKGTYHYGKKDGLWTEYDADGTVKRILLYKAGISESYTPEHRTSTDTRFDLSTPDKAYATLREAIRNKDAMTEYKALPNNILFGMPYDVYHAMIRENAYAFPSFAQLKNTTETAGSITVCRVIGLDYEGKETDSLVFTKDENAWRWVPEKDSDWCPAPWRADFDVLVDCMKHCRPEIQLQAAETIVRKYSPAVPTVGGTLKKLLAYPDPTVRVWTCWVLAQTKNKSCIPPLIALLHDDRTSSDAAWMLGAITGLKIFHDTTVPPGNKVLSTVCADWWKGSKDEFRFPEYFDPTTMVSLSQRLWERTYSKPFLPSEKTDCPRKEGLTAEQWIEVANCYSGMNPKKLDEAIRSCSNAIELDPKNESAFYQRGYCYLQRGDFARAAKDADASLGCYPYYADGYFLRGLIFCVQQYYRSGIKEFTRAIEIDEQDDIFPMYRANAFLALKEFDQALTDIDHILSRENLQDSLLAGCYLIRGNISRDRNVLDAALKDYGKAIELDPTDARFFSNRGIAYAKKGNNEFAERDCNKALSMDPKDAALLFDRGCAYFAMKEYAKALADLQRYLQENPMGEYVTEARSIVEECRQKQK